MNTSGASANPLTVLAAVGNTSAATASASMSATAPAAVSATGGGGGGDEEEGGTAKGGKSALVLAAEACDRNAPGTFKGYLRKKNSQDKWQKRWFELVGNQFWVYYKSDKAGQPLLCAMDLWRAGAPGLEPAAEAAAAAGGVAAAATGTGDDGTCDFHISWDRFRVFRAGSPAEAARWVSAIAAAQAARPPLPADQPPLPGAANSLGAAAAASAADRKAEWNGDGPRGQGGCCASCTVV